MTVDKSSELFAVDVCFGNHILKAFDGIGGGPLEFQQFVARAPNQQIMRHDADSVQAFLKAYTSDAKAATVETAGHRVNRPLLPVCWYCRKPGLASSDMHVEGPYNKRRTLWAGDPNGEDLPLIMSARMLAVALNYNLAFIARDKPTLDKMSFAWFAFVSDTRADNHRFYIPYVEAGPEGTQSVTVQAPALIRDPKTLALSDATVQGTGYFAVSALIEVHATVLVGAAVDVTDPLPVQYTGDPING
ncbi:MAG: hypothetical protein ABIL58_23340 [Pseudomonadota bacterium]